MFCLDHFSLKCIIKNFYLISDDPLNRYQKNITSQEHFFATSIISITNHFNHNQRIIYVIDYSLLIRILITDIQ